MITFDEAVDRIRSIARPLGVEDAPLSEAHRRVLAARVEALVTAPPAAVSAMDGYALREADLAILPARMPVVGAAFAGKAFEGRLEAGNCLRIFTGAKVPSGADRVVIQEIVRREGDVAVFESAPGGGRHIRKAGSDFLEGDVLVPAGTLMGPRQLVAAAAADVGRLRLFRRPRLIVLSTGDELAQPGQARSRPQTIPESVSFGIAAFAEEWGASCLGRMSIADKVVELEQAAAFALRDADVVVVTGGASVGERDFAKQMFASQALELIFSKVAIKPGKPVWLGRAGGRIVLGLPGNPTSALVAARLFLAPLLSGLSGRDPKDALRWRTMPAAAALDPAGDRETFARGRAEGDRVRLASNQDSSAQRTLAGCDQLIRLRPNGTPLVVGDPVEVLDF